MKHVLGVAKSVLSHRHREARSRARREMCDVPHPNLRPLCQTIHSPMFIALQKTRHRAGPNAPARTQLLRQGIKNEGFQIMLVRSTVISSTSRPPSGWCTSSLEGQRDPMMIRPFQTHRNLPCSWRTNLNHKVDD